MALLDLTIPEPSLAVLIGPSGSGKSTFAAKHFSPTEVVSSDACRALVADDENEVTVTAAAFRVLHSIARERLRYGKLTVIDATSVRRSSRKPLLALAGKRSRPTVAIVFDLPVALCLKRNEERGHRRVPASVVRLQWAEMHDSLPRLRDEGFGYVYVLDSAEAVEAATIVRKQPVTAF